MACLETSFLVDLPNGVPAAVERAKAPQASGEPRYVTAPAAAEVLVGAHFIGGEELTKARELLASLILLDVDLGACEEAGRIRADLAERGEALPAADLFIAAIARRHGQRLLTRDRSFSLVRGLVVESY